MSAIKRPTDEQIAVAIEWLNVNEGDQGEMESCLAVAAWLEEDAKDRMLKQESRRRGVPIKVAREAVRKAGL